MAKDMRSWIAELEKAGVLSRIAKPVDPRTQMGALLWQARDRALLFENLTGFPNWRCLGQAPGDVSLAPLAFGCHRNDMVPEFVRRTEKLGSTRLVDTGPVKEKIAAGAEVDITRMPIHQAGVRDGGPFIGSGLVITKNPETGRRNMSFHRLQMKGPAKTGILLYPRHAWNNYQLYEAQDRPMPVAIMIGHHPMYYFAAATTTQYGVDELEIASALLGEEVELVRCETVDLEVPAHAEIVIEGEIPPKVREQEGPFSEFQDYYLTGSGMNPIVNVKAVTMRRDAIFKAVQNGTEVEGCVYHKVPMSGQILRRIRTVGGFTEVKNVLVLPGIFGVVVQMNPRYYGEAKNVLMAVLSGEYQHPKVAIAVDEDVDIFNYAEILWAISTRVNPQEDITIIRGAKIHAMDPSCPEFGRPGSPGWHRIGGKVMIDATKPPACDPARRDEFERLRPMGWETVRLEDFLPEGAPPPRYASLRDTRR
ncbi:MAG TPA: UbiD family decarboxylase [candidate division Zixibacteria bacterium]|nr:UbiD family decarboxylase [candidate division Zixibacteria bacterium]